MDNLETILQKQGRSKTWLAERLNISRNTLNNNIVSGNMNYNKIKILLDVLKVDFNELDKKKAYRIETELVSKEDWNPGGFQNAFI